jgi:hypothetical protein
MWAMREMKRDNAPREASAYNAIPHNFMFDLPDELVLTIIDYLDTHHISVLIRTSKWLWNKPTPTLYRLGEDHNPEEQIFSSRNWVLDW